MRAEWVRSIKKQCSRQKVPFFFKQWGGARKSAAGRVLDGKTYSDFPLPTSVGFSNSSGTTIPLDPWAGFVSVEALAN